MRIVISSEPRLLNVLRGVVRCRAQESGFAESDAEGLAMAINEAAANVIRHTYGGASGYLALEVSRFPNRLEFILEDRGPKVRAEEIRPRSLDEVRPGGLGTLFISTFMDACEYDPDFADGNRLKMIKYFPRKGAPGDEGSSPTSG